MNSLPKTVTRQRHGCDLDPGPSVLESSRLNTWLPSRPAEERGIIMSTALRFLSVCVCCSQAYLRNYSRIFTIFLHVIYGRDSVLF